MSAKDVNYYILNYNDIVPLMWFLQYYGGGPPQGGYYP